jgi:hypothetical protein
MPEAHRIKKADDGNEGPAKHPGTCHVRATRRGPSHRAGTTGRVTLISVETLEG